MESTSVEKIKRVADVRLRAVVACGHSIAISGGHSRYFIVLSYDGPREVFKMGRWEIDTELSLMSSFRLN